jgi:hypothetical protein
MGLALSTAPCVSLGLIRNKSCGHRTSRPLFEAEARRAGVICRGCPQGGRSDSEGIVPKPQPSRCGDFFGKIGRGQGAKIFDVEGFDVEGVDAITSRLLAGPTADPGRGSTGSIVTIGPLFIDG